MSAAHVRPIGGALGAEVEGLALDDLGDAQFAFLAGALDQHLVLVIREQRLDPDAQLALARRFGPLSDVPHASRVLAGYPDVLEIRNKVETGRASNTGGVWHTDMPFLDRPPAQTILFAVVAPPHGGDTMWTNLFLAYERLSPGLRAVADGLRSVHSATRVAGSRAPGRGERERQASLQEMDREVEHPLVRRHPVSGRRSLFVNRSTFLRFSGWHEDESLALHEHLLEHATRPEHTCRVRWRAGTVVIWDNRFTQHFAIDDYGTAERTLHRVVVEGERPVG